MDQQGVLLTMLGMLVVTYVPACAPEPCPPFLSDASPPA